MRSKKLAMPKFVTGGLFLLFFLSLLAIMGCQPSDQRPGLWLKGEAASGFPSNWRFSDEHKEVYLQVATPYYLPHSVTIWCAQVEGQLFVAARNPESKKWPGWVSDKPAVTIKVAEKLYLGELLIVEDSSELELIKTAYAEKYQLEPSPGKTPPPMRYWQVKAR